MVVKLFKFIGTIEPLLYSNYVTDDSGKMLPTGTALLNIITQSYYRIQNQTNYKVLSETNLQKQMVDSANIVLDADKTLQCINLLKHQSSNLLGCKLFCNVNLQESGIYGILLHQAFDILHEFRYDGWRDLKKYKNRVEFKSFDTQYNIYLDKIIAKFVTKIDISEYADELYGYFHQIQAPNYDVIYGLIRNTFQSKGYGDFLFLKTKILSDVFNISQLETTVENAFKSRVIEVGSDMLFGKKTLILHGSNRRDWNADTSYVSYLYYIETILKCLIEIEQQETTGNEVVLNH
jgi:hypothetical protein